MPETTLTINHADGGSETYTINRDKFEGVRNMARKLGVDAGDPENITEFTASGSSNVNLNGTFTLNVSGWQRPNADGYIRYFKSGTQWFYRDYDGEEGTNTVISNDDVTYPWQITNWLVSQPTLGSFVGGTPASIVTDTVSVDRSKPDDIRTLLMDGQTITIDTSADGVRTLTIDGNTVTIDRTDELDSFIEEFGQPAAAYSLRDLNNNGGKLVNARRASDGVEVDVFPDTTGALSTSSSITATSGSTTATTLGDFLTEATPARNRIGSARYDTLTPDGVTGFTAITNNVAACGFDIAGSSGTAVQVSFDIVVNSGSVGVKLRPDFETGSDVSNEETITTSGSKSFTLTSTADFKALLFITASADFVVSNFSVNVPYNHDAFVTTWYDQSGNDKHAAQGTDDNQPKLAEAGVLVADGIDFAGTNDVLTVSDPLTNQQGLSLYLVANIPDGQSSSKIAQHGLGDPDNAWNFQIASDSGNPLGLVRCGNGTISTASTEKYITSGGSVDNFGQLSLYEINHKDGVGREIIVNGTSLSLSKPFGTDQSTTFNSTGALSIGANADGSLGVAGAFSELIIYDSDQSDNRTAIEANINDHYSIY